MDRHALVVAGGDAPNVRALNSIQEICVDFVICADSGLDHAFALGLTPDLVIGDMDSVSRGALDEAGRRGISIVTASPDKDLTDIELAIAHLVREGVRSLTVLAGGGDRFDHVLGLLAAAAHPDLAALESVTIHLGDDLVHVIHGGRSLAIGLRPGTTISLVPLAGTAHEVTAVGLRWPLDAESLHGFAARGVSNETTSADTVITVGRGVVAVVIPGHYVDGSKT